MAISLSTESGDQPDFSAKSGGERPRLACAYGSQFVCIEPRIDNFPCIGNNSFLGTFFKRCGAVRKCNRRTRRKDHCSPAFSNLADQQAMSLIGKFFCQFSTPYARWSALRVYDIQRDQRCSVRLLR
jgi:hypothetical protein